MDLNYTLRVPGYYVVWITCLLPEYEGRIVAGLVKKGYSVGPLTQDTPVCFPSFKGSLSALFVLTIYCGDPKTTAAKVNEDLLSVINQEQMFIHSAVVIEYSPNLSYVGSNIQINKPALPPPSPTNRNLN